MILLPRSPTAFGMISNFCAACHDPHAPIVPQHQPNTNPNKVQKKQIIGNHFIQQLASNALQHCAPAMLDDPQQGLHCCLPCRRIVLALWKLAMKLPASRRLRSSPPPGSGIGSSKG